MGQNGDARDAIFHDQVQSVDVRVYNNRPSPASPFDARGMRALIVDSD